MIVHDDANIRALWHQGTSDFVLITFGDMLTLADGEHFYADRVVRKSGMTCLGLMAKAPNWFPIDSVYAAAAAAAGLLAPYRDRITYGGSMGGYGALKFAAVFRATLVMSFCPQWSIDRAECDGTDPGWTEYFRPAMAGMGVGPSDLAGRVFLFVDLGDPVDRFHQARICAADPLAVVINVPMCGHNVTSVLAGTDNLVALIKACRSDRRADLHALVFRARRQNPLRNTQLLQRAIRRFPRLASRILLSRRSEPQFQTIGAALVPVVVASLDPDSLVDHLEFIRVFAAYVPSDQKFLLAVLIAQIGGGRIGIGTYRQTIVVFDLLVGYCRHVEQGALSLNRHRFLPVSLRLSGDTALLSISVRGLEITLHPRASDGYLVLALSGAASSMVWDVAHRPSGPFSLRHGGKFLCADQPDHLCCDRDSASMWEAFTVTDIEARP